MIKVAAPSSHPFVGCLPCASAVVLIGKAQTKNAASPKDTAKIKRIKTNIIIKVDGVVSGSI